MIREAIYNRMAQRGINQTKLCNDLGLLPQNISAFLRGHRGIPYSALIKILNYLGLTFSSDGKASDLPNERVNIFFKDIIKGKYGKINLFVKNSGISGSTVSSFLSGKRHPSYFILEKMTQKLNIDIVKR